MSVEIEKQITDKYPDIEFVTPYINARSKSTIRYKSCGCTKECLPYDLKRRGNNSVCSIHGTKGNSKKSHEVFVQELSSAAPGLQCITKYNGAKCPILVRGACGHEWEIIPNAILNIRRNGHKCPTCESKVFKLDQDTVISRVHEFYPKYSVVSDYISITRPILVRNLECLHEFEVTASLLLYKTSGWSGVCPICNVTTRKKTTDKFIEQLANINSNLGIVGEYTGNKDKVEILYKDCGHTYITKPNDILDGHNNKCIVCNPTVYGAAEDSLAKFIESNYDGWIIRNDRSILEGKELDIVLPDLGLAFEYNGIKWHSDSNVHNNYHADKTYKVSEFGYKLIHVFEDEWANKKEIVESRILSALRKNNRIYARKCTISEIGWDTASQFINKTHIRGCGAPTKINIGLFLDGELVALQTFGKPKVIVDQEYELVRYCSKLNTNVIGGASKLLGYFLSKYTPKGLISYSDKRWSDGTLYKKLGFKYSHTTNPGYSYYKRLESFSRYKFQKAKLKVLFPEIYDDNKTEFDIMKEAGYLRVHDSGNDVWIL